MMWEADKITAACFCKKSIAFTMQQCDKQHSHHLTSLFASQFPHEVHVKCMSRVKKFTVLCLLMDTVCLLCITTQCMITGCWNSVLSCGRMLQPHWQIFCCIAVASWLARSSSSSSPACPPTIQPNTTAHSAAQITLDQFPHDVVQCWWLMCNFPHWPVMHVADQSVHCLQH